MKEEKSNKRNNIDSDPFRLQICLNNKIIEDLTSRYKTQLMPLNLRNSNIKKSSFKKALSSRKLHDEVNKGSKKGVSFLDEKLKSGFTNAAFVPSPTSESTCAEDSSGGIVNVGFVPSPIERLPVRKRSQARPKPIASPSTEFLLELDAPASEYAAEKSAMGISNDAFVKSPNTSSLFPGEEITQSTLSDSNGKDFGEDVNLKCRTNKIIPKLHPYERDHLSLRHSENEKDEGFETVERTQNGFATDAGSAWLNESFVDHPREVFSGCFSAESQKNSFIKGNPRFLNSNFPDGDGSAPELQFSKYLRWKHGGSLPKLQIERQPFDVNFCQDFGNRSNTIDLAEKGMDFWVDGFKANNKKKYDKINKINIHLHALFSAVEHGHVEKARTILESTDVDVNSLNGDNLTPLDVAVLTNHRSLAKMLLAFGAQEGNHFQHPEKLGVHLKNLIIEAEKKIQDLNGGLLSPDQNLSSSINNNNRASVNTVAHQTSSVTGCHGGAADSEKELILWERKAKSLKKMLLGFEQTRPPEAPQMVSVDVTGNNSVLVRFQGPEYKDSSICTKFKVQWSENENFDVITGEREITDVKQLDYNINDLSHGTRYWFRIAAGNLKGYGNFKSSTPASVIPSSWRDLQKQEPRFTGRLHQLDNLFADIRNLRPENASEIKDFSDPEKQGETPALQRRNQKKKTTIKQLFTVTGKFQKNLKRGIYLVSLFYHDDRVLVTNEDFLPAVEVDETYPSSIYNDLHWFMKVACTWNDVKSLKQDMEKNLTSTTSHFRIKLLQAAQQMQTSLSTHDLGQLFYKPIRDAQGTLVFCTINHCSIPKSISVLNLRWTPISKIQKKVFANEESNISELLMTSVPSQITYHQHSNIKLSRGLYLGYLKMKSSVDLIQIIVPSKTPNVLPHCKVRDNPHISSEEWDWLKRRNCRPKTSESQQKNDSDPIVGNEQQQIFVEQVANTARRLFSYLDVNLEDAMSHRLYDLEVVDLNSDISFLIIVPPVETSCSVPGQKDVLLERGDLMSIPVQVFEMVHLGTYQPEVISRYSRLSCILELDVILAQHSHREAFSSSEVQVTKNRLSKLQELQSQLNQVWKSVRWIMDVIAFARDRGFSATGAVPTGSLQSSSKSTGTSSSAQNSYVKFQNFTTSVSNVSSVFNSNCSAAQIPAVTMKHLFALTRKKESSKKSPSRVTKSKCLKENHQYVKCEKRSLLQIPDSPKDPKLLKSNLSRGSWPGPEVENGNCFLETNFSKSEQHLNISKDDGDVKIFTRKYSGSDCSGSSHYVTIQSASNVSLASQSPGKFTSECLGRKVMTSIGNRLPFSKSEDHLLLNQDLQSFKQSREYRENRNRSNVQATMSVSATNSPLLSPKNLYNNLLQTNADSSLSITNTNTSGSLHSISSDESTAAVVSLPVTIPFRNRIGANPIGSVQISASLLSLAKPIIPTNSGSFTKTKIPVTSSLNSLTDKTNTKRTVNPPTNLVTSGSILSGNTIPVNINQIPARNSELSSSISNMDVPNVLNRHISSSLPSFNPLNSGTGTSNLMSNYSQCKSIGSGRQRQSPVKSTSHPGSSLDAVILGGAAVKRFSTSEMEPFLHGDLASDLDLLHHPGIPLDSPNPRSPSIVHNSLLSSSVSEQYFESGTSNVTSGVASGTSIAVDNEVEDPAEDLGNGVKVPTPSSGILQVYAAYETGLAAGTSLKLHVTPRTSAREVVDLVVKQLNMAVLLKGKDGPIYLGERLKNFCLVAVIGARERCLRDDFKPLQLQNPWKKGRLYVRQKQDVLAALEHSSRQSAFL